MLKPAWIAWVCESCLISLIITLIVFAKLTLLAFAYICLHLLTFDYTLLGLTTGTLDLLGLAGLGLAAISSIVVLLLVLRHLYVLKRHHIQNGLQTNRVTTWDEVLHWTWQHDCCMTAWLRDRAWHGIGNTPPPPRPGLALTGFWMLGDKKQIPTRH